MQSNPILNQINNQRGHNSLQIQPYKNLLHQIQNSSNPEAALQNVLAQNPNIQRVLHMIKAGNGNLEQLAKYMANQRGIDINKLIRELQS